MKFKRFSKLVGILVVIFIIVQILSYLALAEKNKPETLIPFLPQHVHFESGTQFEFACISANTWNALSADQKKILDDMLHKYFSIVYHGIDEVPQTKKYFGGRDNKILTGLEKGCILSWEQESSGLFWFKGGSADWEGNLAASGRTAAFVWICGKWFKVWTFEEIIS